MRHEQTRIFEFPIARAAVLNLTLPNDVVFFFFLNVVSKTIRISNGYPVLLVFCINKQ